MFIILSSFLLFLHALALANLSSPFGDIESEYVHGSVEWDRSKHEKDLFMLEIDVAWSHMMSSVHF